MAGNHLTTSRAHAPIAKTTASHRSEDDEEDPEPVRSAAERVTAVTTPVVGSLSIPVTVALTMFASDAAANASVSRRG
jgi:hypothetical protein